MKQVSMETMKIQADKRIKIHLTLIQNKWEPSACPSTVQSHFGVTRDQMGVP